MMTVHETMKTRLLLGVAVLAMVVCGSAAQADTHYVDLNSPDPREPYTSVKTAAHDIQSAVKAAEVGDTVQVAAGTYKISKTIDVGKAITVQGAGADNTTIDAEGKCSVVSLSGATLKGFTITGGKARSGAGVTCGSGATLADCTISKNDAERYGGGVYSRIEGKNLKPALIRDCHIVGNRVTNFWHTDNPWGGGGLYICGSVTVRNCRIEGNEAAERGGGVYCHFGAALVENCTIVGNRAMGKRRQNPNGPGSMEEGGGGAYCDFGGQLRNCLVIGNKSDKIGGGVVLSTGSRVKSCTIVGNTAGLSGGGVQTLGVAWIVNSIMHGNTRGPKGQADDLLVSHYYHVDIHQLTLGKANAKNSCIGATELYVTRQRFYLGPTAGYDPKWYKNTITLSKCVEEAPAFVDASAGKYQLKTGSPCIDAGADEDWMKDAKDLDGKGRLQGAAVDIGAYETPAGSK